MTTMTSEYIQPATAAISAKDRKSFYKDEILSSFGAFGSEIFIAATGSHIAFIMLGQSERE
jgi:hypothetical protein